MLCLLLGLRPTSAKKLSNECSQHLQTLIPRPPHLWK